MKIFLNDFDKIPQVQRNGLYEVENYGTIYYVNGKLHREDGPAEEYIDGDKRWRINNKLHRLDGPAIEHINGNKFWFINGKRHRLDGPAIEYYNGDKSYYIKGKKILKRRI